MIEHFTVKYALHPVGQLGEQAYSLAYFGADMFYLRAYHGRVPTAGLHPNSLRCFNSRE